MSRRNDENNLYRLLQNDLLTQKEYNEELKRIDRYWDEIYDGADFDKDSGDDE